jgi:ABC-type nitrate/sulfonate/bicarbonate transport system substrate-binding protein
LTLGSGDQACGRAFIVAIAVLALWPMCALAQTASPSDPRLPAPTKIRFLSTITYFALEFVAQDKGLFQKYNLEVEFVPTVAVGGAGAAAIVSGQVQAMYSPGIPAVLQTRAGGAEVIAVFGGETSAHGDYRILVKSDSGIKDGNDLIGKTVGINNPGTYADIALQSYLLDHNARLDQVRRITVPPATMCHALLSNQIDAVMALSLFYLPCQNNNPGKVKDIAKDVDGIPFAATLYTAYVFTRDYIEANPAVVRAFVAALNDAITSVKSDPVGAKQIIAKWVKVDPNNILVPGYPPGGCIDMAAAGQWVDLLKKMKVIPEGANLGDWATNKFNPNCP